MQELRIVTKYFMQKLHKGIAYFLKTWYNIVEDQTLMKGMDEI